MTRDQAISAVRQQLDTVGALATLAPVLRKHLAKDIVDSLDFAEIEHLQRVNKGLHEEVERLRWKERLRAADDYEETS